MAKRQTKRKAKAKTSKKAAKVKNSNLQGRPEIEIPMDQLEGLCRLKPTLEDCAAFFKCSPDTIELRIKQKAGLVFTEFRDQFIVETRYDLIRAAIAKAKKGDNQMLMFCLKNMSKWSDKAADIEINNNLAVNAENVHQILVDMVEDAEKKDDDK